MSPDFPKLLVVDKSIFHALHHCDEKLCAFVKNYNVVLPHTLAIECIISEKKLGKEPDKLLRGLDKAVKAGANIGYQSAELLEAEKTTLCPVKSIVDEGTTQQLRNSTLEISDDSMKQGTHHCMEVSTQKINGLLEHARTLYENVCENQTFLKSLSKQTNKKERLKKWIQIMDHNNVMNDTLKAFFSEQISSHADANWYTWQFVRIWCAYCWDWSHKKSLPGSCEKKDISNDFYDIEPVLYLLRADGLLTNDKWQVLLAKTAFPKEKDIFIVNTSVNTSRKVQDVFDDIISRIPGSYRIE